MEVGWEEKNVLPSDSAFISCFTLIVLIVLPSIKTWVVFWFPNLKGEKGAERYSILKVNYKKTREQEYSCLSIFIYPHSALDWLISLVYIWLKSLSSETWRKSPPFKKNNKTGRDLSCRHAQRRRRKRMQKVIKARKREKNDLHN